MMSRAAWLAALVLPLLLLLKPLVPPYSIWSDGPPTDVPAATCDLSAADAAVQHLSKFLQFKTLADMSAEHGLVQPENFKAALEHLHESYPAVFSKLQVEYVGSGGYTLLITWNGSDLALPPVLLISHYDVVPVTAGTEDKWVHPPFSGEIADGYLWGRGALDIKFGVIGILEALEGLLQQGFTPVRTIMATFGQDEEVGGTFGAHMAASLLESRGVRFEVIIDEGGAVLSDGLKPFTKYPVAVIGMAEKGYVSVGATIRSPGGHASRPPLDASDVGSQLSRFIGKAVASPFTITGLPETATNFLQSFMPLLPLWTRPILWNAPKPWASFLLARLMALTSPNAAAMVRTTTAVTAFHAGVADNVMPQSATVSFNCRPLPGISSTAVLDHFKALVKAAKVNADVGLLPGVFMAEASNVTKWQSPHFKLLSRAIQEHWQFDGKIVLPVPYLVGGGTDSKHYAHLSNNGILRFVPYEMTNEDTQLVHATNERVRLSSIGKAVCSYKRIITLFSAADLSATAI